MSLKLQYNEISFFQTKSEIQAKIKDECSKVSTESGKALNELAAAIKTMMTPSSASSHIVEPKNAANYLKSLFKASL